MLQSSFQREARISQPESDADLEQNRADWRPESDDSDRSDVDFELDSVSAPETGSQPDSEPVSDHLRSEPVSESASNLSAFSPLNIIHILRSTGGTLLAQIALYGRLAEIEWKEQKLRLAQMILFALLGFICLLCVMVFVGVLVLAFSWDTDYRVLAVLLLIAAYCAATGYAWRRFQTLAARSGDAFAATRAELAADIALLKSKL
jgi:uncharacterized membrane protein YqjE